MKNGRIDSELDWDARFDEEAFENSDIGLSLTSIWNDALAGVYLTSVGSIIGKFVFDEVTGFKTVDPEWT